MRATVPAPSITAQRITDTTRDLVVVDVQPSMEKWHGREYAQRVVELMSQSVRVLVLYMGEEDGFDDVPNLVSYYLALGLDHNELTKLTFVRKSSKFFSPWFDGNRLADIVTVATRMLRQGCASSAELGQYQDDGAVLRLPDATVMEAISQFDGAYLVGGERGYCLDEIELLAQALGSRLHTLENYVWVSA